jgi:poly(3-hydroxybutyrate) depolymerase
MFSHLRLGSIERPVAAPRERLTPMRLRLLGGLCMLALAVLPSFGTAGLAGVEVPGSSRLVLVGWGGPDIRLWYIRPPGSPSDAPVLFVMHGVGRDADRYLLEWRDLALRSGVIVVVPEFSAENFPGAENYNFGAVFDDAGKLRPRAAWSYSSLEPMFDALRREEKLDTARYWLFGHSAGAQFVHRLVMLGGGPRMIAAMAANSGSYMMPSKAERWPFGLDGSPADDARAGFATPMVVMLGDADNDPAHRSLPRQEAAMRQGPHRFARGRHFYDTARRTATEAAMPFDWSCVVVPGVAHDNAGMARSAIRLVLSGLPPVGRDCAESVRVGVKTD